MKLPVLQTNFQDYLMDQSDAILPLVVGNSRADTKTMLGVYHFAYKARLVECLTTDFPALSLYMGDEFKRLVHAYIKAHPSQTRSVRWFGRSLALFLYKTLPYKASPVLGDLASFEWAVANAFDGEDCVPADLATMATIPVDFWGRLGLSFHPTLGVLELSTRAADLRDRLLKDETFDDIDLDPGATSLWLVWRKELEVQFHKMAKDESIAFSSMRQGADFAAMCELMIPLHGEERAAIRAAEILRFWLDWGLVSRLDDGHVSASR